MSKKVEELIDTTDRGVLTSQFKPGDYVTIKAVNLSAMIETVMWHKNSREPEYKVIYWADYQLYDDVVVYQDQIELATNPNK